jgi:hypothetical protein
MGAIGNASDALYHMPRFPVLLHAVRKNTVCRMPNCGRGWRAAREATIYIPIIAAPLAKSVN